MTTDARAALSAALRTSWGRSRAGSARRPWAVRPWGSRWSGCNGDTQTKGGHTKTRTKHLTVRRYALDFVCPR